jgi:hypothetical protein
MAARLLRSWVRITPAALMFVCCVLSGRDLMAARLLRSWVRIPPAALMFMCCLLSGRDLCDELITRPRGVLPTVERRYVRSRNFF